MGEEIRVAWKTEEMEEIIDLVEISYRDGRLNGTSSCRHWWRYLVLTYRMHGLSCHMYRQLTKYISSINLSSWHIYTNQHYITQIARRGCSVGTVARLGVGRPRNRRSIPERGRRFFSSVNRPDQVWTQPPIGCNG
jgi:hypothetical protein